MSEYEAGRELDALVAERVMGERYVLRGWPQFSTDIAEAWRVVEELGQQWAVTVENGGDLAEWDATFWAGDEFHSARAGTVPLAICRAALKAVGAAGRAE